MLKNIIMGRKLGFGFVAILICILMLISIPTIALVQEKNTLKSHDQSITKLKKQWQQLLNFANKRAYHDQQDNLSFLNNLFEEYKILAEKEHLTDLKKEINNYHTLLTKVTNLTDKTNSLEYNISSKELITKKMLKLLLNSAEKKEQQNIIIELNKILNKIFEIELLAKDFIYKAEPESIIKINQTFKEIYSIFEPLKDETPNALNQIISISKELEGDIKSMSELITESNVIAQGDLIKSEEKITKLVDNLKYKDAIQLNFLQENDYLYYSISAIALLLYIAFCTIIYRKIFTPLMKIKNTLKELARGNLNEETKIVTEYSEINDMVDSLQNLREHLQTTPKNIDVSSLETQMKYFKYINYISSIKNEINFIISSIATLSSVVRDIDFNISNIKSTMHNSLNKSEIIEETIEEISREVDVNILIESIYDIAKKIQIIACNVNINHNTTDIIEDYGIKEFLNYTSITADIIGKQVQHFRKSKKELTEFITELKSSFNETEGTFTNLLDTIQTQGAIANEALCKANSLKDICLNLFKTFEDEEYSLNNISKYDAKEIIEISA